jgi:hypothetical protein
MNSSPSDNKTVSEPLSASAWSAGIKNGLNARVSFRRATIVSTGPYETERAEWSLELDAPIGMTIDEIQDDLEEKLDARATRWRARFTSGGNDSMAWSTQAQPSSTPTRPAVAPPASAKLPPSTTSIAQPPTPPASSTSQKSRPTSPIQPPQSQKPVQPDPVALERSSGWKIHSTGRGDWIRASEENALREYLLTCKDKTAILGNYRYKVWGSADDMLSRWRHGGPK